MVGLLVLYSMIDTEIVFLLGSTSDQGRLLPLYRWCRGDS